MFGVLLKKDYDSKYTKTAYFMVKIRIVKQFMHKHFVYVTIILMETHLCTGLRTLSQYLRVKTNISRLIQENYHLRTLYRPVLIYWNLTSMMQNNGYKLHSNDIKQREPSSKLSQEWLLLINPFSKCKLLFAHCLRLCRYQGGNIMKFL